MSRADWKLHAALGAAGLALALSAYAAFRGPAGANAGGAHVCVDQEARAQLDRLRRALADREALIARLSRATGVPDPGATPVGSAQQPSPPASPPPPDQGPRRYVHFQIPNPAVSVTQKEDGTYEIRTTDPSLAGTTMQITAVTQSGEEDKLFIRIPP